HLFRVGEAVDCLDVFRSSHTGEIMTKWRFAVVVAAEEEEEDGRLRVRVHFRHWASKWDVWLDTVDDLHRLAPPLSRARAIPASASRRGSSSGGGGALRQRGLEVVEVEPDGNCLFRAVGHQIYGDAERHVEVRRACVDHMGRHKARFATFVAEEEFRDYLRRVRQPCVWGGGLEIRAREEVCDRP
ncbi:unnamed protein product, partial [Phaeothamnion confervicola]